MLAARGSGTQQRSREVLQEVEPHLKLKLKRESQTGNNKRGPGESDFELLQMEMRGLISAETLHALQALLLKGKKLNKVCLCVKLKQVNKDKIEGGGGGEEMGFLYRV